MYISTFDNVIFEVSSPLCPRNSELRVLMAADCSPESKFAVYGIYDYATQNIVSTNDLDTESYISSKLYRNTVKVYQNTVIVN